MPVAVAAVQTAVIANAASLSGEIDLGGVKEFAIVMPAAWTAANLTFQSASVSGGTLQDVYDDVGTEVTVTAAAGRTIGVSKAALNGLRFLKIRSGTAAVPVAQGAERTLTIIAE